MSFSNLIRGLFGRRGPPRVEPDPGGPLSLRSGDRVAHYQAWYEVMGSSRLSEKDETRTHYHLSDGRGARLVLVAEVDAELVLSLQKVVPVEELSEPDLEEFRRDGVSYRLTHRGEANVVSSGEVPPHVIDRVLHREYEDDEEERIAVIERWGERQETRIGEYIHEGELSFERKSEDAYELKAPPRLDANSIRDANESTAGPLPGEGYGARTRQELEALRGRLNDPGKNGPASGDDGVT